MNFLTIGSSDKLENVDGGMVVESCAYRYLVGDKFPRLGDMGFIQCTAADIVCEGAAVGDSSGADDLDEDFLFLSLGGAAFDGKNLGGMVRGFAGE